MLNLPNPNLNLTDNTENKSVLLANIQSALKQDKDFVEQVYLSLDGIYTLLKEFDKIEIFKNLSNEEQSAINLLSALKEKVQEYQGYFKELNQSLGESESHLANSFNQIDLKIKELETELINRKTHLEAELNIDFENFKSQNLENLKAFVETNKQSALNALNALKAESLENLETSKNSALSALNSDKASALNELSTLKQEITENKQDALSELTQNKQESISAIEQDKQGALNALNALKAESLENLAQTKSQSLESLENAKNQGLNALESIKTNAETIANNANVISLESKELATNALNQANSNDRLLKTPRLVGVNIKFIGVFLYGVQELHRNKTRNFNEIFTFDSLSLESAKSYVISFNLPYQVGVSSPSESNMGEFILGLKSDSVVYPILSSFQNLKSNLVFSNKRTDNYFVRTAFKTPNAPNLKLALFGRDFRDLWTNVSFTGSIDGLGASYVNNSVFNQLQVRAIATDYNNNNAYNKSTHCVVYEILD
ncbi:hypothetical protein [Helicobacter cetorum]|uniref:hypothetical protein n=1 Tax=Helicobacter cetorum TaxID=138563 RepID=UPI000CF0ABAB|nr:hypothetical protein [Helicobacter cetorum]